MGPEPEPLHGGIKRLALYDGCGYLLTYFFSFSSLGPCLGALCYHRFIAAIGGMGAGCFFFFFHKLGFQKFAGFTEFVVVFLSFVCLLTAFTYAMVFFSSLSLFLVHH
jgi:hypothetical protein